MGKTRRIPYGDKGDRPPRKQWNKQNRRVVTQQLDDLARRYNMENRNAKKGN